jgi:hypothetical protein
MLKSISLSQKANIKQQAIDIGRTVCHFEVSKNGFGVREMKLFPVAGIEGHNSALLLPVAFS